MKQLYKITVVACVLQCLMISIAYATGITYDWTGAASTDWSTAGNWKVGGVTASNYPGSSATDIAQIGVANVTISRQPTLSAPITITTLTIGTKTANTLTINAALAISGDFTQKNDASGNGVTSTLTGSGSISCNNFYVGDSTAPLTPVLGITNSTYLTTVNFSSLSLTVSQNFVLTTTTTKTSLVYVLTSFPAASVDNPIFNFNSGTISIGGAIQTVDANDANIPAFVVLGLTIFPAVTNSAQFLMSPAAANTATLNLSGANALNLDGSAGYVDFDTATAGTATVNYNGSVNQEVYTTSAAYSAAGTRQYADGLDRSPDMYQDLTFSGALVKKADAGSVTVANNLTLSASSTETVDFATNSPIVTVGGNFVENSGTILNQGGTGTMTISGISNNAGTLNQTGSGNITFTGTLTNAVSTGFVSQTGSGSVTASRGITNAGSITQGTGTIGGITVTGTFNNSGEVTQTSGAITVNGDLDNSGTLTLGTANLLVSGNYNNTGTYSQSSGTTQFDGSAAETLQDASSAGTNFNNLSFSGTGAKTMSSGAFSVASTSVLTMIGSSTLAAGGNLTLKSDTIGSATVAALPSGASITGNVNVQRFLSGGSLSHRGYRLLSSPVNQGSGIYSINYLINSMFLTGSSGTAGGFDKTGNPTIYLFRENLAPNNSSFITGNYRGIGNISAAPNYTIDIDGGPYNIPLGNGFLCFFRGNRGAASLAAETTTTYVPVHATLTATGVLNADSISVKDWYTPSSWNLGHTLTTGNDSIRGYNLVGNPYASSIDWDKFQTSSTTTGIYGHNVKSTIYVLDEISKTYGSYISGSGGVGSQAFVSNILSSGQGFFVVATCSCAKLTFNESAKTNTLPTGAQLLMSTNLFTVSNQYLRLQLTGTDSTVTEQTLVHFKDQVPLTYTDSQDAFYKPGFGDVSLSSRSSDMANLSIYTIPLPGTQSRIIGLNIGAAYDGIYTLKLRDIVAVANLYDVWLMDAYKKDSIDMRQNKIYSFNIYKNDTASFGSKRFTLVIRQNPAYTYQLLNFAANKVTGTTRQVQLTWEAINEGNYTAFTIERSTDSGNSYETLGGVKAAGQGSYSFLDISPAAGTNLYRLEQQDINNNISYSRILTIQYSDLSGQLGNKINIYPNPTGNDISIDIAAESQAPAMYNIKLINTAGQTMQENTSSGPFWQGSVSNLPPGTYILRVFNHDSQNLVGESKFVKLQ